VWLQSEQNHSSRVIWLSYNLVAKTAFLVCEALIAAIDCWVKYISTLYLYPKGSRWCDSQPLLLAWSLELPYHIVILGEGVVSQLVSRSVVISQ